MSEPEIGRAADGSENKIVPNKIKGQAENLDDDQAVFNNTEKVDGKWRYYSGGQLVAETDAPGDVTHEIISQWAGAVRARCKRQLTQEDIDRKLASKENAGGIVDPNGEPISSADTPEPVPGDGAAESSPVSEASVDDDPDAFVQSKIDAASRRKKSAAIKAEELLEELQSLQDEITAAEAEQRKWEKMKETISED
jgi:hypothetical protein